MELTAALGLRRSVRSFEDRQISERQLQEILSAAAQSPAAMGRYDRLKLLVVQDSDLLCELNADFAAMSGSVDAMPTYGAPTVIFVLERREDDPVIQGANAAGIIENMALAAVEQGLGGVYLLGMCQLLRDSAHANAVLHISPQYAMISAFALGYPEMPALPREPNLQKIATVRL